MYEMMKGNLNILQKIKLGIGTHGNVPIERDLKSFIHFISCLEFSDLNKYDDENHNNNKKIVLNSPDFVLKKRKGSIFEHAILLACILISVKSKQKVKYEDYDKDSDIKKGNHMNMVIESGYENSADHSAKEHKKISIKEGNINNDSINMKQRKSKKKSILNNNNNNSDRGKKIDNNGYNTNKKKEGEVVDEYKKINYKKQKYAYTKKDIEIIKKYGIDETKIEDIEKKNDLDAVIKNEI
jgi:hypothetical protein